MPTASSSGDETTLGLVYAAGAFLIWGLFPIYSKQTASIPAVEVLAHRIVWSTAFTAFLMTVLGQWPTVKAVTAERRLVMALLASATIISINWGVFIWAVASGRVLESSLGYFINPLVSVVLGVLVLHERLRIGQWLAVGLAACGVALPIIGLGTFPWVSLTLAVSFGLYGLIRKVIAVDTLTGLFSETLLLTPIALGYLALLRATEGGAFATGDSATDALLVGAGIVTALPLLLFVAGAKRIRLSTLGLLQYIAPTGQFLLAVGLYGEPFPLERLVSFGLIWLALVLYSVETMRIGKTRP